MAMQMHVSFSQTINGAAMIGELGVSPSQGACLAVLCALLRP